MIVPDLTLVLQIINFCIAYLIMQKFVFAPALKIIQAQDHYQKSLEQKLIKLGPCSDMQKKSNYLVGIL